MKKSIQVLFITLILFTSCENEDWDFPDFDYSTVYFAYQTPARTLILGDDVYDNSLDNEHKFRIMATMAGVYDNENDVILNVSVDNSLTESISFSATGESVVALPSSYYNFSSGNDNLSITIPKGELTGGIEVQLADAFFDDPLAIANKYVIPLRINTVQNVDSILSGKSDLLDPDPRFASDWTTAPKNYVLYGVKYINPYHGIYLRRGVDDIVGSGGDTDLDFTYEYHEEYVEYDEVVTATTTSIDEVSLPLASKDKDGNDINYEMLLKFNDSGDISLKNPESATYTLTGTGKFVTNGDEWGNEERDVLHLDYTIDFGITTHAVKDTLVIRDRGVKFETFGVTAN